MVGDEFVRDPVKFSNESTTFADAFSDFFPRQKKKGLLPNPCFGNMTASEFMLFFYKCSRSVISFNFEIHFYFYIHFYSEQEKIQLVLLMLKLK